MKLIGNWAERLKNHQVEADAEPMTLPLRKSAQYYAKDIRYLQDAAAVRQVLDFLDQRDLAYAGLGIKTAPQGESAWAGGHVSVSDPHAIDPVILTLAVAEPIEYRTACQLFVFAVDLRNSATHEPLEHILKMKLPFAGHNLKEVLFGLWRLGLEEPGVIWDTQICERLLALGRFHIQSHKSRESADVQQIRNKEEAREKQRQYLSLEDTCIRYGQIQGQTWAREKFERSIRHHEHDQPFTREQITCAAEDAVAVAKLYPLQTTEAAVSGVLDHLLTEEMAWVRTNARMQWNGVGIDVYRRDHICAALNETRLSLQNCLEQQGLNNVNSEQQLAAFFQERGLIEHFCRDGKTSFNKSLLKKNQHLHPAVLTIRNLRRIEDMLADHTMLPGILGVDGRIHPQHDQLGTDTGRQTSRSPNILGMDGLLRPLLVPEEGYGIGEADWSQMEVGIAAAEFDDSNLIEMFNAGDIYSRMAQQFYSDKLHPGDRDLPGDAFKKKHHVLRDQMKTCTLGLLYQMTAYGLAEQLDCSISQAENFKDRFLGMFPGIQAGICRAIAQGTYRGYATAAGGVRRYRSRRGTPSRQECNWFFNHQVQGSAAVAMKVAGNRLDRLYRGYGARLIIALHDSFVFEAPLECLAEVAALTNSVMVQAVQERYPKLRPRVDVNIAHPGCWNKGGKIDELEKWLFELQQSALRTGGISE